MRRAWRPFLEPRPALPSVSPLQPHPWHDRGDNVLHTSWSPKLLLQQHQQYNSGLSNMHLLHLDWKHPLQLPYSLLHFVFIAMPLFLFNSFPILKHSFPFVQNFKNAQKICYSKFLHKTVCYVFLLCYVSFVQRSQQCNSNSRATLTPSGEQPHSRHCSGQLCSEISSLNTIYL